MSFTCPRCGMTSHHPTDETEGYCGNCNDWTGPLMSFKPGEPPIGPNHALLIGELAGSAALRIGPVTVLDTADGIHTDAFLVERPSGLWRITIKPEQIFEP